MITRTKRLQAAALELIPFAAVPLFVLWLFGDPPVYNLAFPLSLVSGLGYWRIGRPGTGCLVALIRAVVLLVLTLVTYVVFVDTFFCDIDDHNARCSGGSLVVYLALVTALLGAFVVSTVGSAIAVGVIGPRHRD